MKKTIFAAALGLASSAAYADPIVVSKPVLDGTGYPNVSYSDTSFGSLTADKITPASGFTVTGVTWYGECIGGFDFFGDPSEGTPSNLSFTMNLYGNTGNQPGSLLGTVSLGLNNGTVIGTSSDGLDLYSYSASVSGLPSLTAGTTYWLGIEKTGGSAGLTWGWEFGSGANNDSYVIGGGYNNGVSTAYTLTGVVTPVPEPSTLALAGLGGLSMVFALHRKKA